MAKESKDITPKFGTPDKVAQLAEETQKFETLRGQDRALIDALFNGEPPITEEEAEKNHDEFGRINWGETGKILDDANRQVNSALIFKPRLVNLKLLRGKAEKRTGWSHKATGFFNDTLMRGRSGRRHTFLLQPRNQSMTLHGVGAIVFPTKFSPKGRFVPLADLLIPTGTNCDLEDLAYFFVNFSLTQGELFEMVGGEDADEGWNMKAVYTVLHWLQDTTKSHKDPYDPYTDPEKWEGYRKENSGFYCGNNDEVPKVKLRMLYFKNPKTGKWFRKAMLRYDCYQEGGFLNNLENGLKRAEISGLSSGKVYLFDSKEVFADHLFEFLHIQYGDSNRVAPLKHHSARGIGVPLYAPGDCMNRLRNQFMQHVFINLLTWFRVKDQADRDRLKHFVMDQYAAMPQELEIVPAAERYQIDVAVVEAAQSQFRQLMNESSASYVRDIESGNKREMTLGEFQGRLQQVSVQVSGMLKFIYAQEVFLYEEILRRYFIKGSTDAAVKKFWKQCKEAGIPAELMVASAWQVDIEKVMGDGDQTLAQMNADKLLTQKGWMDPDKARIVERDWLYVTTGDASKAELLMPESQNKNTDGAMAAQALFGTLMQGTQVVPREGIDQQGYIEQMLTFMGEKVQMISATDNMGTPADVIGLTNVGADIQAHMAILARDPETKPAVKKFTDAMAEVMNLVKAFAQRQQAAMPVQEDREPLIDYRDAPPEIKRQIEMREGYQPATDTKAQMDPKTIKAVHSAQLKDQQFVRDQKRKDMEFQLEQARENLRTVAELKTEDMHARQQLAFDNVSRALEAMKAAEKPATNGDTE